MSQDLAFIPATGPVPVLVDALTRLAWYGAPALDAQACLWLADTPEVRAALQAPAPDWAGSEAAARLRRLSASVRFGAAPRRARRVHWLATHPQYGFHTPRMMSHDGWRLDELAEAHAVERWVRFGAGLLPPCPDWVPFPRTGQPCVLVGPGVAGLEQARAAAADGAHVVFVLTAWLQAETRARFSPDVIVVSDALSVVGPSEAAQQTRHALVKAREAGAVVIAPQPVARLLHAMLPPGVREGVVSAPEVLMARRGQGQDRNVVNLLALPLAASLSGRVVLAGLEGLFGAQAAPFRHADELARARRHKNLRLAHPMSGLNAEHTSLARAHAQAQLAALRASGVEVSMGAQLLGDAGAQDQPVGVPRARSGWREILYQLSGLADARPLPFAIGLALAAGSGVTAAASAGEGEGEGGHASHVASAWLACAGPGVALATLLAALAVLHLRARQNRMLAQHNHDATRRLREALRLSEDPKGAAHPQGAGTEPNTNASP